MDAGSAMLIDDHVNLGILDARSKIGALLPTEMRDRAAAVRSVYDREWTSRIESEAWRCGIAVRRGTYVWTLGPSYETRAEIGFFKRVGGDAIGMSTVPETVTARLQGMRVAGISSITNLAAGLHDGPLKHDDVLEIAGIIRQKMIKLVEIAVRERPPAGERRL
jgi:purine-nucleoside phosphorylase